ncbi:MAG: hypothetical protein AAB583_04805 [Patescibacteria group bacterium]
MAEQTEYPRPQQPPFTEEGVSRMNQWFETASEAIAKQPQPNKNRLFLLRELRQAGCNLGYEEKSMPEYALEGNKNSDILMEWDTLDNGELSLRLQLDGLAYNMQTQFVGIDMNNPDHRKIRLINEVIEIRNQLREGGINIAPTFVDAKGTIIDLPEEKIRRKVIEEPEMPPQVPLRDQEFSFDPHTGAWYGSPKINED